MTFDEIIRKITSGLTGEWEHDGKYLQEQMDQYKEHELAKEILRACGRMMYEVMPEDLKQEINAATKKDQFGYQQVMEEVRFNMYKKEYSKALELIEGLVTKLEEARLYENDSVSEYFTFDGYIEEVLYDFRNNPDRELRRAQIPFSEIYFFYGNILFELQQYEKAKSALDKALRWNPMNASIAYERAELEKQAGNLEEFLERTKAIMKNAYKSEDIARGYRNIAFYFVEKKEWAAAKTCLIISTQFSKDKSMAQSELYYIDASTEGRAEPLGQDEMYSFFAENDIQVGADDDVLGIAYNYGKHFLDEKEYDAAEYFLNIVYELTDDAQVKAMIDDANQRRVAEKLN